MYLKLIEKLSFYFDLNCKAFIFYSLISKELQNAIYLSCNIQDFLLII